jgi:signal recognition particle GTPase
MRKILLLGNLNDVYERINNNYKEIGVLYDIIYHENTSLDIFESIEELDNSDKIVIHEEVYKDLLDDEKSLDKINDNQIIVITKNLNSIYSQNAILRNHKVHYINSPVSSLVNKIDNIYSLERNSKEQENIRASTKNNKKIAFISPVGGSGKTTISLNMAAIFAEKEKKVLLVDLSMFSDIAARLRIEHKEGLSNVISKRGVSA